MGPNPIWLVFLWKGETRTQDRYSQRKDTHGENHDVTRGRHIQGKECQKTPEGKWDKEEFSPTAIRDHGPLTAWFWAPRLQNCENLWDFFVFVFWFLFWAAQFWVMLFQRPWGTHTPAKMQVAHDWTDLISQSRCLLQNGPQRGLWPTLHFN